MFLYTTEIRFTIQIHHCSGRDKQRERNALQMKEMRGKDRKTDWSCEGNGIRNGAYFGCRLEETTTLKYYDNSP